MMLALFALSRSRRLLFPLETDRSRLSDPRPITATLAEGCCLRDLLIVERR